MSEGERKGQRSKRESVQEKMEGEEGEQPEEWGNGRDAWGWRGGGERTAGLCW